MEDQKKYSFILRNLHLIGGIAFVVALVLGLVMEEMERGPEKFQLMFFHKSLGLAVLGLAAFRLLEWLRSPQPKALDSHAKWEQLASKVVKVGLYVVMIGFPVSGLMMSWYAGYPAAFFGLFEIAPPFEKNEGLNELFGAIHHYLMPATLGLLALHVAGAVKHHVMDKDETLTRISPFPVKAR
jgi:cytochrome b561